MRELCEIFQGVEDPRRSNATRHNLHEMLMIGLLSMLTGGRTCVDMEAFGHAWRGRGWARTGRVLMSFLPARAVREKIAGLADVSSFDVSCGRSRSKTLQVKWES